METLDNINKLALYYLTGKYMVGTQLTGLEVSSSDGSKKLLKLDDIYELIRRGLVQGCSLIEDGGKIYIKSTQNKLANLPLINNNNANNLSLTVQARVFKDGSLIGYTASDDRGKVYKLSKDKVWDIARQNGFTNLSATVSNNSKILRGIGMKLRDLPDIKV